jgi:SAM-dependent methyltransferase
MIGIDLGCGSLKKEGLIGVDFVEAPNVDFFLDMEKEPLPFENQSVDYIFSSHFLEHIGNHPFVFSEMSRVAKNGAKIELWLPYLWSNAGFVFGHKFFFSEEIFLHLCLKHYTHWIDILGARWFLKEIVFVIAPSTLADLNQVGIPLGFAIKHCPNVVEEMGIFIDVLHDSNSPPIVPSYSFSFGREQKRFPIHQMGRGLRYKVNFALGGIREMGFLNFLRFAKNYVS